MRHTGLVCLCAFAIAAVPACADAPQEDLLDGPTVAITVAPLELPGVVNADWGIRVLNASGDTVFERSSLSAADFGDGRSLAFVGPCDADASEQPNRVELTLNQLFDAGGVMDPGSYRNPSSPTPLSQSVNCLANQDQLVQFNVTIFREASQGFFDIAVSFSDIFCSAKFDCSRDVAGNDPIVLVHDPDTGQRTTTTVLALACTGGVDADTNVYLTNVTIDCDTPATYAIDPSEGPGNLYTASTGANPAPAGAPFSQVQTFRGQEQLTDGVGGEYNKLFWNMAIGMDLAGFTDTCTLSASATASDGGLTDFLTPGNTSYPVISYAIDPFITSGALACAQNPLDGAGSDVTTGYTASSTQTQFNHQLIANGAGVAVSTYVPPPVIITPTSLLSSRANVLCMANGTESTCWGNNTFRSTAEPSTSVTHTPYVNVQAGLPVFDDVEAGIHGSCGRAGGDVWCWGTSGSAFSGSETAVQRAGITTATQVGVGDEAVCVLLADGSITCFGNNNLGQLGGSSVTGAAAIGVKDHHGCARLASGQIQCWGRDNNGQLGSGGGAPTCGGGGDVCRTSPVTVVGITTAVSVHVGHNAVCAILADETVQCWGANGNGQLGRGFADSGASQPTAATSVNALSDPMVQLAVGSSHACGLTNLGAVYCWGNQSSGRIGNGLTAGNALTPQLVAIPTATEVRVGHSHSCAVLTTGEVYCWGQDSNGQMGNGPGTTSDQLVPGPVSNIP